LLDASEQLVEAFPDEPDAHAIRVKARLEAFERAPSDATTRAAEEAVAALDRLDPEQPAVEIARGFIESGSGSIRPAVARFTTILDRHDLTPALRAEVLMLRGWNRTMLDEHGGAFGDLEEAVRLNPTSGQSFAILGLALRTAGRPKEALIRSRQAVALSPTSPRAHFNLSLVLGELEEWEEAQVAAGRACEFSREQATCAIYALSLHMAGREAESRAVADETMNLASDSVGAYNLACYWARVGNRSEAIRFLRSAVDQGMTVAYMARDPDLESLHGRPEFEAIVAEVEQRIGKK
jgi:tetratricopeptide (TPR) repeat protein